MKNEAPPPRRRPSFLLLLSGTLRGFSNCTGRLSRSLLKPNSHLATTVSIATYDTTDCMQEGIERHNHGLGRTRKVNAHDARQIYERAITRVGTVPLAFHVEPSGSIESLFRFHKKTFSGRRRMWRMAEGKNPTETTRRSTHACIHFPHACACSPLQTLLWQILDVCATGNTIRYHSQFFLRHLALWKALEGHEDDEHHHEHTVVALTRPDAFFLSEVAVRRRNGSATVVLRGRDPSHSVCRVPLLDPHTLLLPRSNFYPGRWDDTFAVGLLPAMRAYVSLCVVRTRHGLTLCI